MSLKNEIEKIIQAERKKLKIQDEKSNEFFQRKKERFKPMTVLLKEVADSFENEYLEIEIYDDSARIEVGKRKDEVFDHRITWTVEPNSGCSLTHQEDGTLFYDEPGFKMEENLWLTDDVIEKNLTFETEQETVEYLIKEIAKIVAQQRHWKKS